MVNINIHPDFKKGVNDAKHYRIRELQEQGYEIFIERLAICSIEDMHTDYERFYVIDLTRKGYKLTNMKHGDLYLLIRNEIGDENKIRTREEYTAARLLKEKQSKEDAELKAKQLQERILKEEERKLQQEERKLRLQLMFLEQQQHLQEQYQEILESLPDNMFDIQIVYIKECRDVIQLDYLHDSIIYTTNIPSIDEWYYPNTPPDSHFNLYELGLKLEDCLTDKGIRLKRKVPVNKDLPIFTLDSYIITKKDDEIIKAIPKQDFLDEMISKL